MEKRSSLVLSPAPPDNTDSKNIDIGLIRSVIPTICPDKQLIMYWIDY